MNKVYLGCDPSFTSFGLAYLDTGRKQITLDTISVEIDRKKPTSILEGVLSLGFEFNNIMYDHRYDDVVVGIELATSYGQMFQAELYALDYEVYRLVSGYGHEAYLYGTGYIKYIKNMKQVLGTKEDTIFFVQGILDIFKKHGYSIDRKVTEDTICSLDKVKNKYPRVETIASGSADAFIFALRMFIRDEDNELTKEISELYPRLLEDKELK